MELFLCILFAFLGLVCYIWYVLREGKKENERTDNH